jgi:propanediol dehydratase small subunit
MDSDELKSPETLRLRLDLAKSTGREDLAKQLENEIRLAESGQT